MSVTLISAEISHDTLECIEALHKQVTDGEVTGLAFVATTRKKGYIADTAGAAWRNPTFALGAVMVLAAQISHRIRGK